MIGKRCHAYIPVSWAYMGLIAISSDWIVWHGNCVRSGLKFLRIKFRNETVFSYPRKREGRRHFPRIEFKKGVKAKIDPHPFTDLLLPFCIFPRRLGHNGGGDEDGEERTGCADNAVSLPLLPFSIAFSIPCPGVETANQYVAIH